MVLFWQVVLTVEDIMNMWGQEAYIGIYFKFLYLPLNFVVNLRLFENESVSNKIYKFHKLFYTMCLNFLLTSFFFFLNNIAAGQPTRTDPVTLLIMQRRQLFNHSLYIKNLELRTQHFEERRKKI